MISFIKEKLKTGKMTKEDIRQIVERITETMRKCEWTFDDSLFVASALVLFILRAEKPVQTQVMMGDG